MARQAQVGIGLMENCVGEAARVALHHHQHHLHVALQAIEPGHKLASRNRFAIPQIERRVMRVRFHFFGSSVGLPRFPLLGVVVKLIFVAVTGLFGGAAVAGDINDQAVARGELAGQFAHPPANLRFFRRAALVRHFVIPVDEIHRLGVAKDLGHHSPRGGALLFELRIAALQVAGFVVSVRKVHLARRLVRPLFSDDLLLEDDIPLQR
jgi:hypothetical protein